MTRILNSAPLRQVKFPDLAEGGKCSGKQWIRLAIWLSYHLPGRCRAFEPPTLNISRKSWTKRYSALLDGDVLSTCSFISVIMSPPVSM